MSEPNLQFRPLRPAVSADQPSTLDLLITVATPDLPAEEQVKGRPPLNLALVIDRSGSMGGRKLSYARKAARFLVSQLTGQDRLGIVTFEDEVEVVMPSNRVTDPQRFISAINRIQPGGCTALFDGWLEGAKQVAQHIDPAALNRILLLSDGQANQGLTDHREIAASVAGLTARGIATSAFGLGSGFDEDLMGAIATAGDGTLAFIETPDQLGDLYASELQGLAATFGRRVSLGIRPSNGAQVLDVFNDLHRTERGNYKLPNLRAGQEFHIGVRLELPAWSPNQEILSARLAWDVPGSDDRFTETAHLTLPVMAAADVQGLDADPDVREQLAMLRANRERRLAIERLDRGDLQGAEARLDAGIAMLSDLPTSDLTSRELKLLLEKKGLLHRDRNLSRKRMSRESLRSRASVWEADDDG